MKKLLIVTAKKSFNSAKRFKTEAEELAISYNIIEYQNINFMVKEGKLTFYYFGADNKKIDIISNYSNFIFRGSKDFTNLRDAILQHLSHYPNKYVLNELSYKSHVGNWNKLIQFVELNRIGIPLIDSELFSNIKDSEHLILDLIKKNGKVITKILDGTHGKGIALLDNNTEISTLFNKFASERTFIQKYIDIDNDYRILILDNECLGVMKKTKKEGMLVTNFSQGGSIESVNLDKKYINIAIKAAQHLRLDFCGVDLIIDKNGDPYILEINRMPQFRGFEKSTGVNVAKNILNYLIKKSTDNSMIK